MAHQLGCERGDVFRQLMLIGGIVGEVDLAHAGDLGGGIGDGADALTGDQSVDFAQLRGGGDGGKGGVLDGAAFSKAVPRTVMTSFGSLLSTVAMALPA